MERRNFYDFDLSILPTEITLAGTTIKRIDWTAGLEKLKDNKFLPGLLYPILSNPTALRSRVELLQKHFRNAVAQEALAEVILVYQLDKMDPKLIVRLMMSQLVHFRLYVVIPGDRPLGHLIDVVSCKTWQEIPSVIEELRKRYQPELRPMIRQEIYQSISHK